MNISQSVAQINITPAIGTEMTGFIAREGPSTGVLDPLFARALVLDDGEQKAAIITMRPARLALSCQRGASSNSGAHRNPRRPCHDHLFAHPRRSCHARFAGLWRIDPAYMAQLHNFLVTVTQTTCKNQQPVQLTVGHGQVTDHVHNRRTPAMSSTDLGVCSFAIWRASLWRLF